MLADVIQRLDERAQTATKTTNVTDGAKNSNAAEFGPAVLIDEPQNSTVVPLDKSESSKAVLVDESRHSNAVTVDKPQSSADKPQDSKAVTVEPSSVDEPQHTKAVTVAPSSVDEPISASRQPLWTRAAWMNPGTIASTQSLWMNPRTAKLLRKTRAARSCS